MALNAIKNPWILYLYGLKMCSIFEIKKIHTHIYKRNNECLHEFMLRALIIINCSCYCCETFYYDGNRVRLSLNYIDCNPLRYVDNFLVFCLRYAACCTHTAKHMNFRVKKNVIRIYRKIGTPTYLCYSIEIDVLLTIFRLNVIVKKNLILN